MCWLSYSVRFMFCMLGAGGLSKASIHSTHLKRVFAEAKRTNPCSPLLSEKDPLRNMELGSRKRRGSEPITFCCHFEGQIFDTLGRNHHFLIENNEAQQYLSPFVPFSAW